MKIHDLKIICRTLCCVVSFLLLNQPVDAAQIDPLLQRELAASDAYRKIPVVVRMHDTVSVQALASPTRKPGPLRAQARVNMVHTLKSRAERSLQPLQAVLNRHGIHQSRRLWLINGQSFSATPAQIAEIAQLPQVASILADAVIEAPRVTPAQVTGQAESNISLVHAPDLWAFGYAGQGVTVAIMDSGVDINHPDLGPSWRGGSNSWYDPNGEHTNVPTDTLGHGTQVTGLVLGGNSAGTYIGMAPEAQWIGVKIFADNGGASTSVIHAGFQWLLDPDGDPLTDDAPDIVNNSWGYENDPGFCDAISRVFQPDVQALKAAGIAVVFSAGNAGPNPNTSVAPANYPESFAVGSVGTPTSMTDISTFSSRGPSACDGSFFPEVVAPGYYVKTSDLTSGGAFPNTYVYAPGTSFAAPHVSGAMALLLGAYPGTPISLLESSLTQSAVDLGDVGEDNTYGFGLIDSLAAFYYLETQVNSDFHLLAPNHGETWRRGATYTVRWVPNPAADNYRLAYFDADNTAHPIGAVGNVDKYEWTIPLDALAESGKRLRVAAFNGAARVGTDLSDQPFTILPHMFPNDGDVFIEGSTYNLTWAPVPGADKYRLYYFDADSTPHYITNVGNVTNFSWTVPYDVLAEPGKRFRVTAFSGATKLGAIQFSEGTFTVVSQLFPNGGEVLTTNASYLLTWAAIPSADLYRLFYFDASGTPHFIANVRNATSYGWQIPGDALIETGKSFRVTAFNGTTRLATVQWSDWPFSILAP